MGSGSSRSPTTSVIGEQLVNFNRRAEIYMVRVAFVMRGADSWLTVVAVEQVEAQMFKEGLVRLVKRKQGAGLETTAPGHRRAGRTSLLCNWAAAGRRRATLGQRQEPTIIQA